MCYEILPFIVIGIKYLSNGSWRSLVKTLVRLAVPVTISMVMFTVYLMVLFCLKPQAKRSMSETLLKRSSSSSAAVLKRSAQQQK